MKKIEQIARALAEHTIRERRRHDTAPEKLEAMMPAAVGYAWREFVPQARVAVEAMREPTDAMLDAGAAVMGKPGGLNGQWDVWSAMIDAALTR